MTRARTLEDILGTDGDADAIEPTEEVVDRINKRCIFVLGKGVIREDDDGGFQLLSVRQFNEWSANKVMWTRTATGGDKATPESQIWMQSARRRECSSIVLDPRGQSEGQYNLWRGFSFEPSSRGSCDLFLDHLFDNVCGGDEATYLWLIAWMAHLIQRPWEKPGTAVVLKGKPGVGKSTVGEHLGALISRHRVTVYTSRGLVGQFNAHMASALLVQIEEGFWAGDRAAENALKHLITGPTIQLEKKGVDSIELPSFHRYLITSNEHWTVPVRHEDRRYGVFNVGDARQRDEEYFGAIAAQMKAGGYRALMRYLLDFDLDRINVRAIPQTEALAAEKITSLKGVHAWWHDVLAEGVPPGDPESDRFDAAPRSWSEGPLKLLTNDMRTHCEMWVRSRRHQGDIITADAFGRELRAMCPSAKRVQQRNGVDRLRLYELPPLDACRAEFSKWLNSEVDWA